MRSSSYRHWLRVRSRALDELEKAHGAVSGTGPGARAAMLQINHAYILWLAAQFQGYCRDLHTECMNHLANVTASSALVKPLLPSALARGRQLDRGNAHSGSLGDDFSRLGIDLAAMEKHDQKSGVCRQYLDTMNAWRNAIAHQDFLAPLLGGSKRIRLARVRAWRKACNRLARSLDEVVHGRLLVLTGAVPW